MHPGLFAWSPLAAHHRRRHGVFNWLQRKDGLPALLLRNVYVCSPSPSGGKATPLSSNFADCESSFLSRH